VQRLRGDGKDWLCVRTGLAKGIRSVPRFNCVQSFFIIILTADCEFEIELGNGRMTVGMEDGLTDMRGFRASCRRLGNKADRALGLAVAGDGHSADPSLVGPSCAL